MGDADEAKKGWKDHVLNEPFKKVEYLVVAVDDKDQKVRLSLRQADILKALAQDEELAKDDKNNE